MDSSPCRVQKMFSIYRGDAIYSVKFFSSLYWAASLKTGSNICVELGHDKSNTMDNAISSARP